MIDKSGEVNTRDDDYIDKKYMGVVEDANDPRKEGRAKIRVFGIFDDLATDDLPWAYPKNKSTYFGKDGKGGSISIPKVHSVVAVEFNNGNIYSPEFYSIHELADDVKDELSKEGEYHGTHICLFDGDEELKIWFTVEKGLTLQLKGSRVNIGQDKAIQIEHADSSASIELRGGEININANSTINIVSDNEVNVTSNSINIDGNAVKIGHNTEQPAVLGDDLFKLLHTLASAIDAKWPASPGLSDFAVSTFENIALSKTVTVTN
jgi:hypothetical protein